MVSDTSTSYRVFWIAYSLHAYRLQKTYAKNLARLRATGEGVGGENEDGVVHNTCLVPVDGPDNMTPGHAVNLWSECVVNASIASNPIYNSTDEIHASFPWFGALHRILSSRPNLVPPAIVTGVGLTGREIIYNNLPPPSQEYNSNIDPALYSLGRNSPTPTRMPQPSQHRTPTRLQEPTQAPPFTPLFVQPGVPSQPLPRSQSATPALLPLSQQEATPSSPRSKFAAVMAKAKENVKVQPRKRPLEDLLSEGIL